MRRSTGLARSVAPQRHLPPKKTKTQDDDLDVYYQLGIATSTWYCWNCDAYIPHCEEWKKYAAQCHIVDKDKHPEVKSHPLNRLHLCLRCHNDWDSSWLKAFKMVVFPRAKQLFKGFQHLVKKIPDIFLR